MEMRFCTLASRGPSSLAFWTSEAIDILSYNTSTGLWNQGACKHTKLSIPDRVFSCLFPRSTTLTESKHDFKYALLLKLVWNISGYTSPRLWRANRRTQIFDHLLHSLRAEIIFVDDEAVCQRQSVWRTLGYFHLHHCGVSLRTIFENDRVNPCTIGPPSFIKTLRAQIPRDGFWTRP